MTEKEFLKKLRSKDNRDGTKLGDSTSLIVVEFLTQNKLTKPNLVNRLYNKVFRKETKVKTPEQIVTENFETIIDTFRDLSDFGKLDVDRILEFCNTLIEREDTKGFGKDIVIANIDKIYPMVQNGGDLFKLVQFEKSLGLEINEEKDRLLQGKKVDIAKYMLDEGPLHNFHLLDSYISLKKREEYSETLAIMLDELLHSENCRYSDINSVTSGGYSQVYKIGNKILKVGKPRASYSIPNHRRLLQPLIRTNLIDEENNNIPIACIEIQDGVDLSETISKEELYYIYKELREDGIIWSDAKIGNIGKLRRDNVPTLEGERMDVAPNSVGFINGKNDSELSTGDWVIIDSDFVYREDDPNLDWAVNSYLQEFEQKYQSEKAKAISEKYMKDHEGEDIYSLEKNQISSNSSKSSNSSHEDRE